MAGLAIPEGIVTRQAVEAVRKMDIFGQLSGASQSFLKSNREALAPYVSSWVKNPFDQWSRQYEYPFTFGAIEREHQKSSKLRILDAGSGATFFPFFISERLPSTQVYCCDYDAQLVDVYHQINEARHGSIDFKFADIRSLPYPDQFFDILYCVSVLEHTGAFRDVLAEFSRVLKPAGKLILTFDVSVDGTADIPLDTCRELISDLSAFFRPSKSLSWVGELDKVGSEHALSTRAVAKERPDLLPWKYPALVAIYKSLRARKFPRTLFRDLNCYCLIAEKK